MAYIDYDGTVALRVKCKGDCGVVLIDHGFPTPEYCEIVLEMREPNGLLGKHETAVCKACRRRLMERELPSTDLENIYAEDVEQWIISHVVGGHTLEQSIEAAEYVVARTPIRLLMEHSRYHVA
jgi:hypothetical protein